MKFGKLPVKKGIRGSFGSVIQHSASVQEYLLFRLLRTRGRCRKIILLLPLNRMLYYFGFFRLVFDTMESKCAYRRIILSVL